MTLLLLVKLARCHGVAPGRKDAFSIVRMKHALPPVALQFLKRESHVRTPLRIAEIQRAIGRAAPDLLRNGVDHQPQMFLSTLYVVNVGARAIPSNNPPALVF